MLLQNRMMIKKITKPNDSKVLIVEDVITTGKSSKECLVELKKLNINLLGIACIVDRSSEDIFSDHEIISLIKLDIPVYDEKDLPDKLKSINPIKPGSRII